MTGHEQLDRCGQLTVRQYGGTLQPVGFSIVAHRYYAGTRLFQRRDHRGRFSQQELGVEPFPIQTVGNDHATLDDQGDLIEHPPRRFDFVVGMKQSPGLIVGVLLECLSRELQDMSSLIGESRRCVAPYAPMR